MKNSLHKEIATEARRASPLKSDLVACWRLGAKGCRHRVRHDGNPLCSYGAIGRRCTRSLCPIRTKIEGAVAPPADGGGT